MDNLIRFEDAFEQYFEKAFSEIKAGKKLSHRMWFIFPQIIGPGISETSKYYGIDNIKEA